ncbi:hypothetical protein WQ54_15215 [Bacillus sp. SA1-12]|nr:hypothetical protein WQ54_15215 [Bacillus sp. SA1-12]
MKVRKIRCPECGVWFEETDMVYINEHYTLMHEECSQSTLSPIMDKGNYLLIGQRYFNWSAKPFH